LPQGAAISESPQGEAISESPVLGGKMKSGFRLAIGLSCAGGSESASPCWEYNERIPHWHFWAGRSESATPWGRKERIPHFHFMG